MCWDLGHDHIAVNKTSGYFVILFVRRGNGEGESDGPYGITSDQSGFAVPDCVTIVHVFYEMLTIVTRCNSP